jgi:16S rRNA (guanine527-N7)-methyltransferase
MTRYVNPLQSLGISEEISPTLESFQALFAKWNASINLSAARTEDEIAEHVIDSLHVIAHVPPNARVVDVGSGGGFPSVVLAICRPDAEVTALEPVHKKHAFLRSAARLLELGNFQAFARRFEDHDVHDYDVAMSRATLDLREWLEAGQSLVRVGGLVFGFEAIERTDLPESLKRYSYELAGKQRAIVSVERSR